jgi:RNA polymerase sigma factor (sigma-70 family)
MNDSELLSRYVRGSEEALAELVRRHVDLVYGAALRQVRDPGLAEDVTQQVFIALSRKAPRLVGRAVLAAWLYNATRYLALDALKMRARRRRHERKAAEMARHRPEGDSRRLEWDEIEGVLDGAMARLSRGDRTLLLLRYWQGHDTVELAGILRISDDTVRKRLSRATERLRKLLARNGAGVSVAALGPLLAANVIPPAPSHLTAKVIGVAINKAVGSAAAAKGTALVMATIKAKSIVVAVVAVAAVGGAAYVTKELIAPGATPKTVTLPAAGPGGSPVDLAVAPGGWESRFNAVYGLGAGEVLKRIAPPYIPERVAYWNAREKPDSHYDYSPDVWIAFSWDGALHRLEWSDGKSTCGTALTSGLAIRPYQVEGPVDLWKIPLPGDLVCRSSASADEKMKAFAPVLTTALGKTIRFEKKRVTKNAIVVRGAYVPPDHADKKGAVVQVIAGPLLATTRNAVITAGGNFFYGLEEQTRLQVIDQTAPRFRGGFTYTIELLSPDIGRHPERLRSLLDNLTKQTGFQFSLEPRETDVWVWVEG